MALKSLVAKGWQGVAKYIQNLEPNLVTLTGTQTLTNKTITGGTSAAKNVVTTIAVVSAAATIQAGTIAISHTAAATVVLAAPSVAQAGTCIDILSLSNYAHVVTFTGGTLDSGITAARTTATFAAYAGAGIGVQALNERWTLKHNNNVTLT